jgi:hypothetical protein
MKIMISQSEPIWKTTLKSDRLSEPARGADRFADSLVCRSVVSARALHFRVKSEGQGREGASMRGQA